MKQADAQYDSNKFELCAQSYLRLAGRLIERELKADAYYNAACCYARANQPQEAFTQLSRATAAGYSKYEHLVHDTDLDRLHDDSMWVNVTTAVEVNYSSTFKLPLLRKELLVREQQDQEARNRWLTNPADQTLLKQMQLVDAENLIWIKSAIGKYGWPAKSLVGTDGARAAWLLVQHSDADPKFQAKCLTVMETLLATGEVDATNVAYLFDRVAVAEKRLQRYGSQFNGTEPFPMEDPASVDMRRASVGLPTLSEYKKHLEAQRKGAPALP